MSKRIPLLRTLAFSLALATGAAGLAHAQPAEPQGERPAHRHDGPRGHHARGHHAPDGAFPFGALKRLKPELALSASQQALWDTAEQRGRDLFRAMREQGKLDRDALRAQLDAGPLDPRALLQAREQRRAALAPQRTAASEAWLAVYDALDATQKQKVTDAVKRMLDRKKPRGDKRHGGQAPQPR